MYNSSDILCLKESKFGENDGTLMFSIKGTSSSKMCTSHNVSNAVFYGQPQMSESTPENPETSILKQDETSEIGLEAADLDVENEKDLDEDESISSSNMSQDNITGDELEPPDPSAYMFENEPSPNRNEYAVGHEASACGEPGISSSNMARNPVTGVGLEADLVITSRKHYQAKPDNLLW